MPTIYHGTPMTPRSALLDVCKGRAMCVSFFRPDDVEVVEAISPDIMFRQWRFFNVEGGATQRGGMGRALGVGRLLLLVGGAFISARQMGGDPRYARSTKPAQRCAPRPVAFWTKRFSPLAHGWTNRAFATLVRKIRACLYSLDRRGQTPRPPRLSRADGRSGQGFWQPLAYHSYDARHEGRMGLSLYQCGWDNTRTKRVAL